MKRIAQKACQMMMDSVACDANTRDPEAVQMALLSDSVKRVLLHEANNFRFMAQDEFDKAVKEFKDNIELGWECNRDLVFKDGILKKEK
jgi:hypothetical protein